jgi:Domain of unknown function (DUF4440)
MRVRFVKSVKRAGWPFAILAAAAVSAAAGPLGPAPHVSRDVIEDGGRMSSDHEDSRRGANAVEAGVRQVLDAQVAAWNRGDVDGFLAGYWNSENTAFAGPQGILHGWQALRERYRKSYPDRKAMGTLAFSALEVTALCPDAALVLGKWHLDREAGPVGGVFSLVLRQFPEGWRIIADHTSVVPEASHAPGQ